MKIAYDYQAFGQPFGGIPRYFTAIAPLISTQEDVDARFFAGLHSSHFLRGLQGCAVSGCYFPWLRRPALARRKLQVNRAWSRRVLKGFSPDILHETYFFPKSLLPADSNVRHVITVHDMVSEQFFHDHDRDYRMAAKKATVQRADHVICISENTKKDLQHFIQVPDEKISVISHGYSKFTEQDEGDIPEAYILFVGARAGYKNFVRFLTAYASCKALMDNFQLICIGGGGDADIQTLERDLCIPAGRVIQRSVSDAELGTLYRHAAAFVYPSLYEGFGIPLLEAMSCSCPVVCSRASCFPEVAGDAAEYFDPTSVESIAEAVQKVVFDEDRRSRLRKQGLERINLFSWDRCAEEHLKVYRSLV